MLRLLDACIPPMTKSPPRVEWTGPSARRGTRSFMAAMRPLSSRTLARYFTLAKTLRRGPPIPLPAADAHSVSSSFSHLATRSLLLQDMCVCMWAEVGRPVSDGLDHGFDPWYYTHPFSQTEIHLSLAKTRTSTSVFTILCWTRRTKLYSVAHD